MKTYSSLIFFFAVLAAGCAHNPVTQGTPLEFDATMTGAAARPNPVATNATGTATISVTRGSSAGYNPNAVGATAVSYSASVAGLSGPATQAHIHGPAGPGATAGPIVTLTVTSQNSSGTVLSGSFNSTGHATISVDSLVVLMRNGSSYVNIHTAANPSGEIRGQIVVDD